MLSNTIPLERREYTPVEIEVAKSVKQESRHFSDERFKTVFNEGMGSMRIGEIVESLIQLKRDKDIYYPNDNAINLACNILERLPREKDVYEWIKENSK